MINKKTINNEKQNKITYIVDDLCSLYKDLHPDDVYFVLLKKGVFKWFSVRKHLIKLKNKWKEEIKNLQGKKNNKEKGYLQALEKCRKEIRELCHSSRWQCPDYDFKAKKFLEKLEKIEKGGENGE